MDLIFDRLTVGDDYRYDRSMVVMSDEVLSRGKRMMGGE